MNDMEKALKSIEEHPEIETITRIIVRPTYDVKGEPPYLTSKTRWIGALYVAGDMRFESQDQDRKGAAYVAVQKAIKRNPELVALKINP